MTWINMLSPLQWALLLAIPPAILSLYFLKLKRQQAVVPSTMLWKRAIEDLHVNSIWQKLRKNLLLYLQLLFVGLLILACLRPGWSGMNRVGERRIYIIDHSASMQATDNNPSRLDVAKDKALKLIKDAASNDSAMVIATSDRASVEQGFTNNRSLLENAVKRIEPTSQLTDVSEAFRVAAGLANPGRVSFEDNVDIQTAEAVPATVYFLSDGAVGELNEAEFGQLKIEYVPIGDAETQNAGILSFAIQRPESDSALAKTGAISAFARLIQHGADPVECTASLYLDDTFIDAKKVKLQPGEETGIQFDLEGIESGGLKLQLDHSDALPLDNVAYAAIRPDRQVSILVITPGNNALETALGTQRVMQLANVQIEPLSHLATQEYQSNSSQAKYDLIIYDSCSPDKMPSASTLFIGGLPPADIQPKEPEKLAGEPTSGDPIASQPQSGATATTSLPNADSTKSEQGQWAFGNPTGPVIVLDVNRSHPISQYLEMSAVGIVESRSVKPPASGSVLMIADIGPIFAVAPRGPFQDAVLGFDIVRPSQDGLEINSDWGIKRSFPVFVFAAVEQLAGGVTEASAPTVQPGMPIQLMLSNRFKSYQIIDPSGKSQTIDRGPDGRFLYTRTDQLGVYEVRAEGLEEPVERFCVNLFSNRESNLKVGLELKTGSESIAATSNTIRARQETWRWLLLLALGLLMLEWIVFNRRIFI
ncbi:MAG: vWA domain-containing protein [Planctomycetota bacterium]|jgi:hypothetical protein